MNSIDLEIFTTIQHQKKLTEIYLGNVLFSWTYAIAEYTADCTEAIAFSPFDKVICGILTVDEVLSFDEIATILGFNVIDNPANNQYKDIAEYEILVESLTSLSDFGMIEKGDSFFSRCRLTEIGKEYSASGRKFKTTEKKEFRLYFDTTLSSHERAKEIFQDIKPDSKMSALNLERFVDENYLKTFAEKQIPEIYSPEYGNSFTNSNLRKIEVYSLNLFAGILYDFQLNTFSIKIVNRQLKTDYFTAKANGEEKLKTTIIHSFFELLQPNNFTKSQLQQEFEEISCEIQNDADYLLYQNKPQEAIQKINLYYKDRSIIEEVNFWQNLDLYIENNITELFFNLPEFSDNKYDSILKFSKTRPNLKIFLAFGTSHIDTGKLPENVFWKDNSPFKKFGCFTNDLFIFDCSYLVPYENKLYSITLLTKKIVDNSEKVDGWKKQFAQKYIPILLEEFRLSLQNDYAISSIAIESLKNADSKLHYFDKWIEELGFAEHYSILKESKSKLIEHLQREHRQNLFDKLEKLKDITDIENFEKLNEINEFKSKINDIENECLFEDTELFEKIKKLKKELSEKELYIKDQLLAKHYIIDTNVFIDCPEILSKIDIKHNAVLSAKVVDELDNLKRKLKGDDKSNAEKALKLINVKLSKKKNIKTARADFSLLPEDFDRRSPDNQILCVALMYKDKNPFLLTSDNGLQAKAKICNIPTISLKEFLDGKVITPINLITDEKIDINIVLAAYQLASKKSDSDLINFSTFASALRSVYPNFSHRNYGFKQFKDFCNSLTEIFEIKTNERNIECLKLKNK